MSAPIGAEGGDQEARLRREGERRPSANGGADETYGLPALTIAGIEDVRLAETTTVGRYSTVTGTGESGMSPLPDASGFSARNGSEGSRTVHTERSSVPVTSNSNVLVTELPTADLPEAQRPHGDAEVTGSRRRGSGQVDRRRYGTAAHAQAVASRPDHGSERTRPSRSPTSLVRACCQPPADPGPESRSRRAGSAAR